VSKETLEALRSAREGKNPPGNNFADGDIDPSDGDNAEGPHEETEEGAQSIKHTHEHEHADGKVHSHAHKHHFSHHHSEEHEEQHKIESHETFHGKSMKPGGGGRFAKGVSDLEKEGKSKESAGAIMAAAGRKKYGAEKFAEMGAAGRKRA
jgi:hypothetical protein